MIWLTIIGAIVAQAIVVVLIIEYIERRGKVALPQEAKATEGPPAEDTPNVAEKEEIANRPEEPDDAIGKSLFTAEQFKAMVAEVVKPLIKECIEEAMDMRDVEFDKTKEETAKEEKPEQQEEPKDDMRMTAEQESRAWEDLRDEEDKLDKENNDPVPPNPLASGADFEQITAATDTLEHPENHTVHEFTMAVKVIHGLNGTEFTGCLPDSLFERLQQFHRMADRKTVEETMNSEKVETVSKPTESRAEKETDTKETKSSTESNRRDLNEAMALMNEIRECSQKFRNQ